MARKGTNGRGLVVSSVIGGFVGAAGVMMLTTEKGETLRNEIMRMAKSKYPSLSQTLLEFGEEWEEELENVIKGSKESKTLDHAQSEIGTLIQEVVVKDKPFSEESQK